MEGNYEGYMFNGYDYEVISNIIDDYLYVNPTVAIIPIEKDYLGEDVKVTTDKGIGHIINPNKSYDEIIHEYGQIYDFVGLGLVNNLDIIDAINVPQRVRLTNNINPYSFFNEKHVLTCFIPKVRITNKKWKRLLSKAHRTRIARAGSTVAINSNNTFSASPGTFYFDFDISRSDLKNKRWKNVNLMFDPNWHKTKGTQQIIVWTKRSNASNSTVNVKNEIKIDGQGNYTPTTSVSLSYNTSSELKAIFRGNIELDRDQLLTTVVGGSEYENETHSHNSLDLSVRKVATHFEYFFDYYYTNL